MVVLILVVFPGVIMVACADYIAREKRTMRACARSSSLKCGRLQFEIADGELAFDVDRKAQDLLLTLT